MAKKNFKQWFQIFKGEIKGLIEHPSMTLKPEVLYKYSLKKGY